ncbi:MAG: hypothetical protein R3265_04175 [Hyphomonas sp.]|nr:hypothetical protein [Hyphomonas sp.]
MAVIVRIMVKFPSLTGEGETGAAFGRGNRGLRRRPAGLVSLATGEAAATADQKIQAILRSDIIGRPGAVSCLSGHDGEGHHAFRGWDVDVALTGAGDHDLNSFFLVVGCPWRDNLAADTNNLSQELSKINNNLSKKDKSKQFQGLVIC